MDQTAFEALFRESYTRLCSCALTIVRTRDDAEDVVQQVFTNLWRNRGDVEIRGSVRGYLYGAVRNGALNRIRAGRSALRLADSPLRAPVADSPPDPSEAVIIGQSVTALNRALDRLGERPREVLHLRWIDGLTHAEIAETLGITRKAVESNITRGLSALRELLDRGGA
jgi:RNA polymerase sigma-70 factor (ECF subfamily)